MSIRHNKQAHRAGQAVVEFALVLPIFLLLLLGAVDFGRAYYRLHLLTNAARVGARAGSLPGSTETEVANIVGSILADSGLPETFSLEINVTDSDGNERYGGLSEAEEGDRIQVIIEQEFTIIGIGFVPGTDGTIPLNSSCTFRHE